VEGFEVTIEVAHVTVTTLEGNVLDRLPILLNQFKRSIHPALSEVFSKGLADFAMEQSQQVFFR
jgi:hypothetical protein